MEPLDRIVLFVPSVDSEIPHNEYRLFHPHDPNIMASCINTETQYKITAYLGGLLRRSSEISSRRPTRPEIPEVMADGLSEAVLHELTHLYGGPSSENESDAHQETFARAMGKLGIRFADRDSQYQARF